jgi:hypothetical protein
VATEDDGMIFRPELAELVAKGKKTVTRRVVNGKPCAYRVGQDYAVQPGRGKEQICRIQVIDRERQLLGRLTYQDALAEGFRTRADFARYWMALHDPRCQVEGLTADEVIAIWLERQGDVRVWVITFELKRSLQLVLPDVPVYLHRTGSRGSTTTDARMKVPGEPEVMGVELKHRSIALARAAAERERQARIQQFHGLVERARNAYEDALSFGVELAPDVAALERHVQLLEQKLRAA